MVVVVVAESVAGIVLTILEVDEIELNLVRVVLVLVLVPGTDAGDTPGVTTVVTV